MAAFIENNKDRSMQISWRSGIAGVALLLALVNMGSIALAQQKTFASAEQAFKAAASAAKSDNDKELLSIFGAPAKDLLFSGDTVADKQRRERFIAAYDEKNHITVDGDSATLIVGKEDWPFPIPAVKKGQSPRENKKSSIAESVKTSSTPFKSVSRSSMLNASMR